MGMFVNEVGYKCTDEKIATVLSDSTLTVKETNTDKIVLEGKPKHIGLDEASGDDCYTFDFSEVTLEGNYYIENEQKEKSASFRISSNVYDELTRDMLRCLYYQRCGMELKAENAGIYTRGICHTEDAIFIEDFLKGVSSPTKVDVTGGWHDAGDFGRYVSPAAVSVGHLLYAYELYKDKLDIDMNIPDHEEGVADILTETKYELKWMLKMQKDDGGVYHKVTTLRHPAFVMPEEDKDQLLIYPVSSLATADFAAAMAIAYRVYKGIDDKLSEDALVAARKAFEWLCKNDYIGFHNPPESNSGEYDDDYDADERMWAAAELLRSDTAGNVDDYRNMLVKNMSADTNTSDFGWTDVSGLAIMSILTDANHMAGEEIEAKLIKMLYDKADEYADIALSSGYSVALRGEDFVWGSNMVVTNRGILLSLAAYIARQYKENEGIMKCSKHDACTYEKVAKAQMDYILGRNALSVSYVTGYGEHAFKNPHNRVTACDNIDDPMPGWVSGGPFKTPCDPAACELIPQGTKPMKCYADVVGSYSTNEITIYWNTSAILLTCAVK